MPCEWCGEGITLEDEPVTQLGVMDANGQGRIGFVHKECGLREVTGGIGHLIAHEFWCLQHHDPDAGLTPRQSARMAWAYIHTVGLP